MAAERVTNKQIERLGAIIKRMEEDFEKDRLGAKSDLDFHVEIVNATQNQAYNHLMITIYDLLQEGLRIAWGGIFNNLQSRKVLLQQHKKIFDAIQSHDPDKGRRVTREHLEFVEQKWKKAFFKNQNNNLS